MDIETSRIENIPSSHLNTHTHLNILIHVVNMTTGHIKNTHTVFLTQNRIRCFLLHRLKIRSKLDKEKMIHL